MDERIRYKEGAKVGKPVPPGRLPARPNDTRTSLEPEDSQRTGPGVQSRRAENVRQREGWEE